MNEVDRIASKLMDAFFSETERRKVEWYAIASADRSFWRLIARVAIEEVKRTEAARKGRSEGAKI